MAAPRFTKAEVEQRRERVSELYLQGWSLRKIAAEVGVHNTQVFFDIKAIRAEWRANTLLNFDEQRNLELARLDQVEAEAWKGWARTIGKHKVTRTEIGSDGKTKDVETVEPLAGDPRFLAEIRACVRQRCEILGLNAPVEARITGKLSIDDLRAILEEGGEVIDGEATEVIQ